jgi:hypothetical protein
MYPLIAGHSAAYDRNVKMKIILFILHSGLFIIGTQCKFSNLFISWINTVIFIILCLEQYPYLNVRRWFILSYIINYIFPYFYLIIYLCFILYYMINDIVSLGNSRGVVDEIVVPQKQPAY